MNHGTGIEKALRPGRTIGRRELLSRAAPACAFACLGLGALPAWAGAAEPCPAQGIHKFDVRRPMQLSTRDLVRSENGAYIRFIRALRREVGDPETVRLLSVNTAAWGREVGERQAASAPDRTFQSFTATFRPPNYANQLTHEIVEDTDSAFGLRVTECVWASVFREAGLGGDVGHAAICNMDYHWPQAFNPAIRMERTRTLMQGHDHCNHRYVSGPGRP